MDVTVKERVPEYVVPGYKTIHLLVGKETHVKLFEAAQSVGITPW